MENNVSEILIKIKEELVKSNYISVSKGVAITDRIHNISNKIFSNSFDADLKEIKNTINKSAYVFDKEKNSLIGVIERMEDNLKMDKNQLKSDKKNNKIFIVHGRNENATEKVVNFIEKIGLMPTILKDEPNKGYTIIEKFEQNSDVSAAIVLFFAEDIGCLEQEKDKMKPRARQNVIFEFGYFIAKLNRRNVIWLVDNTGIEIPTDISGLGYTMYNENWEESLIKELKEIGFNIKQ